MTGDGTAMGAQADRAALQRLHAALNAWARSLHRDDCGDWRLSGTRGHIYADGDTWILFIACRSARHWTATKKRLAFCSVCQDGDDEGCLRLASLPTAEQAEAIRAALGIRKRLEHSAEALERMRQTAFRPAGKQGFAAQDARA